MKALLIIIISILSFQAVCAQAKKDSTLRADSVKRIPNDSSTRVNPLSPMYQKQQSVNLKSTSKEPKKVSSSYQYAPDGRVTGGNTSLQLGKPSKRKKKN